MKTALKIALFQGLLTLAAAIVWGMGQDGRAAAAAATGGGISVVLTLYTGLRTFAVPAASAQQAMMNFYKAEVRKLLLAAALFAVAVKLYGDVFVPVITTFAATLTTYWFALLWKTHDG